MADNTGKAAAREPKGAENSDPAALPAGKKPIEVGINKGAREAADEPVAADSPVGRTSAVENHNPPALGSREAPQEVRGEPGVADGDGSVDSELREAGPQGGDQRQVASNSMAAPGAPSSASAAGTESSPRIPLYSDDDWIWPGYIPFPGVTAIVGSVAAPISLVAAKVAATVSSGGWSWPDYRCGRGGKGVWLTAQHGVSGAIRDRLAAAGAAFECGFGPVHMIEPERGMFGLPIHDLHRDLDRLEREISSTDKVRVAVIDYVSPYLGEDIEQAIRGLRGAFAALKDFAAKFGIAVIVPCRLPCRGGSSVITRATEALSGLPGIDSVLLVEGTDRGTVAPKKTRAGVDAKAVAFRTSKKPGIFDSASVIEWENPRAMRAVAKHEPNTIESLAGREILTTSDPEVNEESSAVPPKSDETSLEPSPPPGIASSNLIESSAAPGGSSPQTLRAGASAGKPALSPAKPLSRRLIVPMKSPFPKRVPGTLAPFSSVATKGAGEKGRQLLKSPLAGKHFVGRGEGATTKLASKVRKLGKRKTKAKAREKRPVKERRVDPSDWE